MRITRRWLRRSRGPRGAWEEPKLDLSRPVDLYTRIIDDNIGLKPDERYERLDGVYLMLGFVSAMRPVRSAMSNVRDRYFVTARPRVGAADRSHLFLGNYAFAEGDYTDAMAEYEQVIAKGDESPYYNEATVGVVSHKLSGTTRRCSFVDLLDRSIEYERGSAASCRTRPMPFGSWRFRLPTVRPNATWTR